LVEKGKLKGQVVERAAKLLALLKSKSLIARACNLEIVEWLTP
jgi:hypothetical protein